MSGMDFDVVLFEACNRTDMRDPATIAADFSRLVMAAPKSARFGILVGGYDNDPRELIDIPEVMAWLRRFMVEFTDLLMPHWTTPEAFLDRLVPECRPLVLLAVGAIRRDQITIDPNYKFEL